MTYDLRRLRLKGLVTRFEHTNTYTLTGEGIRFAVTYTTAPPAFPPPRGSASPKESPPRPIDSEENLPLKGGHAPAIKT